AACARRPRRPAPTCERPASCSRPAARCSPPAGASPRTPSGPSAPSDWGAARAPPRRRARSWPPRASSLHSGRRSPTGATGIRPQLEAAGALAASSEVVGDERAATAAALERLLEGGADLVVTVGGMGRGPHDHVRPALAGAGVEALFDGLRATSLQPTWLGRRGPRLVRGLPGNRVSSALALHVVGRELLGAGDAWERRLPLVAPWGRDPGRADILMCRLADGGVAPLADQRSHAVVSLAR